MKLLINIFLLVFFVALFNCNYTNSQIDFRIGVTLTTSNYISGIHSSKIKENISFGTGLLILTGYQFNKSKVSSLVYGVELSSIRHSFLLNGFGTYTSNVSLKIPILYQFKYNFDGIVSPLIQIGMNNLIQFSKNTIYSNSFINSGNTTIESKKRGVFSPLLQLNVGVDFKLKPLHSLSLLIGINMGFLNTEEIKYVNHTNNSMLNFETDGSYFDIKIIWKIMTKKHN